MRVYDVAGAPSGSLFLSDPFFPRSRALNDRPYPLDETLQLLYLCLVGIAAFSAADSINRNITLIAALLGRHAFLIQKSVGDIEKSCVKSLFRSQILPQDASFANFYYAIGPFCSELFSPVASSANSSHHVPTFPAGEPRGVGGEEREGSLGKQPKIVALKEIQVPPKSSSSSGFKLDEPTAPARENDDSKHNRRSLTFESRSSRQEGMAGAS
jgi:hypothetical protein